MPTMTPDVPESISAADISTLEDLGRYLRQTREARGLSLAEVSQDTHVRTQYLQGIEQGDLSRLPEPVYVRGFVKRYGDYLGLDTVALLAMADPVLLHAKPKPELTQPGGAADPSFAVALRPVHLWSAYVVLIVLAVGGVSAFVDGRIPSQWTAERVERQPDQSQESQERDPSSGGWFGWFNRRGDNGSPSEAVAPLQTQVFPGLEDWVYISGVFPERSPEMMAETAPLSSVQLAVRIVEGPSWIRVVADGVAVFEGTLQPGAEQAWSADELIVLRAGNAGGVQVTLNNQDLGMMGQFGEVREESYRRPDRAAQAF